MGPIARSLKTSLVYWQPYRWEGRRDMKSTRSSIQAETASQIFEGGEQGIESQSCTLNTLRPRQDGCHFAADDIPGFVIVVYFYY